MNNIFKIPAFQRRKAIPKQLKDLELLPLNEQFSKLTMSIVGDDDMRPVMTGNFFDMESKKIVSTDAHKLTAINMPKDTFNFIAQKYNKELDKEPKGLIFHTLSQLQKDYNSLMKNNNITISFDEFINDRAIEDGRYPNYEAVFPKEFTNEINVDYQKLYWYAKVLLDAKVIDDVTKINTSNANEYQNKKIEYLKDSYTSFLPYTKQIILTYLSDDGTIQYIGFNARLLCDLLKFAMEFNGKYFGKVGISGNNRAMVIELENGLNVSTDSVGLIMPVILNSGEFDNTIGNMDFDLSVAMYYDLDANIIISDKENYPINESIGFMPNKAGLSTSNIRVKEEVSKVENSSADLIDTRIKGYKIALKVAKAENKANIEKKIKGLEIAKRMKKDDLPFAKGGNVDRKIYIAFYDDYEKSYGYVIEKNANSNILYWNGEKFTEKYDAKTYKTKSIAERELKNIKNKANRMEDGGSVDGGDYVREDLNFYKKGGNVKNGINWYKYDGQYEAEFGNFFLYISPSTQRGYYNFRVTDGYRGDTISESQQEILGLDNAKELAIDIVGDYMKQFKKGGSIGFKGLSNKVASNYKGKKVPQRFQSIYGKTYSQSEAQEVGNKVAGKVYREQQANKMAKGGMVEFYDYKGVEIMYEPTYEEYFVNDLVFNSLEKAHKYIDSGEANKTPIYIENLYRRGAMAKGGIIKINDNITIKDNKVMVNGNNGFVNSGTINEWFENSPKVVKEVLNDKDENGEILFTRIAESDNFIYYTMDIKDFNTPNYKLDSIENDYPLIQYEAVHKPSGRSDYWGHWNGWGFMPLQDEFKYGKLNYQHPSLKKLMQQDSYYKSRKKMADGGSVLANNEIMQNIEFEDDTDIKFGRYNFSFDTIDSEGANMFDYDGYIIVQPSSSRQDDEIEWGQNVPEDYDKAESILIDAFYEWKNKKMADGGSIDEQTYIDLFEDYENIPAEVQMILDEYSESFEDGDYIGMSKAQNELEQIGYTFDFYVDGDAYGLRPMNVKLSQIQGYEDEDEE